MFQFDHLVHFVNSPEKAIEDFQAIQLHAVEGGRHEKLGTYNSLSYYGLSYIELIGVFDQATVLASSDKKHSLRETFKKDQYIEGLARIALRSNDLEKDAKRFRDLGLEVNGPHPMSRTRPDGSVVSWKLLYVGKDGENLELPFFIEWDEKDDERQQDLINRSVIAPHPKGDIELAYVGFAVHNLEETTKRWVNYLGAQEGETFFDASLNATGTRLHIKGGDIVLYRPDGEGPVAQTLATRGEKPFIVHFNGSETNEEFIISDALYRLTPTVREGEQS